MKRVLLLTVVIVAAAIGLFMIRHFSDTRSALAVVPDKMVTFTFDDGPDPRFTPNVLRLLQQENVHATFFVIGDNAVAHPQLVRDIQQQGHLIANHTQSHPRLEELSREEVTAQINTADQTLELILGSKTPPQFFRPPRGNVSPEIDTVANELHKHLLLWNVCVENHTTQTPEEVRHRVMKLINDRNGGIILAHDGQLDRTLTVQSLPLIIHDLKQQGYRIVSLDEYLAAQKSKKEADIFSFFSF